MPESSCISDKKVQIPLRCIPLALTRVDDLNYRGEAANVSRKNPNSHVQNESGFPVHVRNRNYVQLRRTSNHFAIIRYLISNIKKFKTGMLARFEDNVPPRDHFCFT